jgi:hypothetical protein
MKIQIFEISEKVNPDMENITGLNLAAVKRTTVQEARQPL